MIVSPSIEIFRIYFKWFFFFFLKAKRFFRTKNCTVENISNFAAANFLKERKNENWKNCEKNSGETNLYFA